MTRSFEVFFDLRLNKRLTKHSWGWWFETPWRLLWRDCNVRPGFEPGISGTHSLADWMPTHKPTELSRIKLTTWTQQHVPMMSEYSFHLMPLPELCNFHCPESKIIVSTRRKYVKPCVRSPCLWRYFKEIYTRSWGLSNYIEHSAWIRSLGVGVPLRSRLWHFPKNTHSCVENECCCPRTVNISSVNLLKKYLYRQSQYSTSWDSKYLALIAQ